MIWSPGSIILAAFKRAAYRRQPREGWRTEKEKHMTPKFFTEIVAGLKWLGKHLVKASVWVPRILRITDDVATDAETLMPAAIAVLVDVDELAAASVKDGGAAIACLAKLGAAIETAIAAKALNVSADEAVLAAFSGFVSTVEAHATWSDVLQQWQKLITDWDAFGTSATAALAKLEQDAAGS